MVRHDVERPGIARCQPPRDPAAGDALPRRSPDRFTRALEVVGQRGGGQLVNESMLIALARHLVPALTHRAHELRESLGDDAEHEHGGPRAVFVEQIEGARHPLLDAALEAVPLAAWDQRSEGARVVVVLERDREQCRRTRRPVEPRQASAGQSFERNRGALRSLRDRGTEGRGRRVLEHPHQKQICSRLAASTGRENAFSCRDPTTGLASCSDIRARTAPEQRPRKVTCDTDGSARAISRHMVHKGNRWPILLIFCLLLTSRRSGARGEGRAVRWADHHAHRHQAGQAALLRSCSEVAEHRARGRAPSCHDAGAGDRRVPRPARGRSVHRVPPRGIGARAPRSAVPRRRAGQGRRRYRG